MSELSGVIAMFCLGRDLDSTGEHIWQNLMNGKLRFLHICILKIPINKYLTLGNDMQTEMLMCILK